LRFRKDESYHSRCKRLQEVGVNKNLMAIITSPESVLAATLAAMERTPNARLRELMASLAMHLHAFVRETRLTEAEFEQIMALPVKTYRDYPNYEQRTWVDPFRDAGLFLAKQTWRMSRRLRGLPLRNRL